MARRFARRRFFRKGQPPVKRQKRVWFSNLFSEDALGTSSTLIEEVIFDSEVSHVPAGFAYSVQAEIRRLVVDGVITWVPQITATAFEMASLVWAVYVIDREDTDNTLISTTRGAILEGGARRVLRTGVIGFTAVELPVAQIGTSFIPAIPMQIDLKVSMKVATDELIVLGMQWTSDVSSAINQAAFTGITRTLLVE